MARTSYEPRRTSPYSEDLRWRMVWQREVKGLQVTKVATNLGVDPSTVSRIVARFRCLGVVHKKRHPSNKVCTKLTEMHSPQSASVHSPQSASPQSASVYSPL